ncbi:flagellar filament capping protein FliD [Thiovibrio frasassiensis]|uniref:Flagellar hook-associated protein 2 n=1 Tax=Thiovibrio frasassiensis TaxID=2984131 RepID=A0A9X4RKM7_9BACT|nr:flagellar filament capping protein FliD [Thiovibrio frasassiensis]MDG4474789.1 flagellar filament capping protein FliD [Thiovibrio frasassiensis]
MAGSISTLGAGSSIDLQGIIEKLKAADQVPITNIKAQQLQYKDQLAEFDTVNTKLLAVKTKALDLSLSTTFLARQISSSQTSVLTATVSSGASTGISTVTVGRLAKQNSWQSSGVATADTAIASGTGTFAYTINGTQSSVAVASSTTLQQLSDAINNDVNNPGVTASVMDDGTGTATAFHLVLVSNETGEANAVTIDTNGTDLTFTEVQGLAESLDAEVTINGITYQRATNTISDIISGVTLNLEATGASSVKVTSDMDSVKAKIVAMIEAYNAAAKEIADNSKYDQDTGVGGSLSGVSTFRTMTSQLNQTLLASIGGLGGAYGNMTDIGLSFDRDGTASLDETVLAAALESNPEDVQLLLVGDTDNGIDGVATLLNAQLRDITKPTLGVIANEKGRVDQTIQRLDDQIESMTIRLNNKYDLLTKQFVQLDTLLSSIQKQGDFLSAQIASLSASKN